MKKKNNNIIKELSIYILIFVIVVLIRIFVATPVRVDGDSMAKNLADGEILLLVRLMEVEQFDIVVVEDNGEDIIKRVYGMPGDTVEIKNDLIYINGKIVNDRYGYGKTSDYEKITLKEDEYFVLGDNRLISKDSRTFGPVKKSEVQGVTTLRLFPFTKIDFL